MASSTPTTPWGSPAHNRVSRLHATSPTADTSDGTDTVLLDLDNLSSATNHNGGGLVFGADGKLYISVGENANPSHSQSKTNLLGKVLRMNSDGSVPTDNPFYGDATFTGQNKLIWAAGLRNPFTFAVQPGTGRLFINDVGSSPPQAREEINEGVAGSNYGWNYAEGIVSTAPTVPFGTYRNPLYAYDHSSGACAIAGGAFYNPGTSVYPAAFTSTYFFADLCGGWVHVFNPSSGQSMDLVGDSIARWMCAWGRMASSMCSPMGMGRCGSLPSRLEGYFLNPLTVWKYRAKATMPPEACSQS